MADAKAVKRCAHCGEPLPPNKQKYCGGACTSLGSSLRKGPSAFTARGGVFHCPHKCGFTHGYADGIRQHTIEVHGTVLIRATKTWEPIESTKGLCKGFDGQKCLARAFLDNGLCTRCNHLRVQKEREEKGLIAPHRVIRDKSGLPRPVHPEGAEIVTAGEIEFKLSVMDNPDTTPWRVVEVRRRGKMLFKVSQQHLRVR